MYFLPKTSFLCRTWPIWLAVEAFVAWCLDSNDLVNNLNTFGLLFKTLRMRDLRVFAEAIGGQVFHYRDRNGLECDNVVHLRNGA